VTFRAVNTDATTDDFEFAALNETPNYRAALIQEFGPSLKGGVIEIGAGIGQVTDLLHQLPQISRLLSMEPDAHFASTFRQIHPNTEFIEGTIEDVPPGEDWDGILSINVMEHIQDDAAELSRYATLLSARRGALCLFVAPPPRK